jgi:glycosyltransferase involved in cell wall biosynthesis
MTATPWHICVLIPARNEEALLPRCLRSVLRACSTLPASVTYDIVVVADSSTDGTRAIAQSLLRSHGMVVSAEVGIVGKARAIAAAAALKRYVGPTGRCWLANTDADCYVPESWLVDHLSYAAKGIEAIAGTVDVDDFAEHSAGVSERFRLGYLIRPDGTHPHVHGANLGVRADVYLRSGGWSDLATAEDHDLWDRLFHNRTKLLSVGRVKVLTSGRRLGRAPHGFAEALAVHNEVAA